MKTHVAALGMSATAAAVLAWRAATANSRGDRALAAWLTFTDANDALRHRFDVHVLRRLDASSAFAHAGVGGPSSSRNTRAPLDAAAAATATTSGGAAEARGGEPSTSAVGNLPRNPQPSSTSTANPATADDDQEPTSDVDAAAAADEPPMPPLPEDFVCPIGAFVMVDPVLCGCTPGCGKSFDRRSIQRWVLQGAGTCPHTGR